MKPIHVMNELNNKSVNTSVNNNGINNSNSLNNHQSIVIGNTGITLQCDHSLNSEMLQVYVNVLLIGFPCLAIEDYETMLKKTSKELNERKDILGLLLSIQCLCEQLFGFLEIAEKTAMKSRNTIIHVFDQFINPIVANTFLNLATFYSSIGNYETSRGYLNMVEHFTNITKTINPFEHEFNEIYNCRVEISSFKVFSAIVELNCCDSYPIPDIKCLTKLFSIVNYLTKKDISVNLESNIENRIENTKVFAYSLSNGRPNRESRERPLISQVLSNLSINIFNNGINIIKSIIDGEKLIDNGELLDENTKKLN